jgi:hypothetical protein
MRATADDPAALPGAFSLLHDFLVHGPKTNKPAAQVQQASTKHGQPITCKHILKKKRKKSYLNYFSFCIF